MTIWIGTLQISMLRLSGILGGFIVEEKGHGFTTILGKLCVYKTNYYYFYTKL